MTRTATATATATSGKDFANIKMFPLWQTSAGLGCILARPGATA
jgi:hypothetical protein